MEKRQILIDSEMNAIVAYDESFRLILSRDDLSEYYKGFVNWHKQPTIEHPFFNLAGMIHGQRKYFRS